jgi:hypothetical protein
VGGAPAVARADVGETIILRCTHGEPLGGFSQSAYAKALKELSADAEEYSNCASLIRQAQLAALGRGGAAPEAALPISATPSEQRALARAQRSRPAPLAVDGRVVTPGVVHASFASALSSLPAPVLAVLAVLAACVALTAGGALRNRFRGRGFH